MYSYDRNELSLIFLTPVQLSTSKLRYKWLVQYFPFYPVLITISWWTNQRTGMWCWPFMQKLLGLTPAMSSAEIVVSFLFHHQWQC
jgi:hypothetical protein